jgi:hypothetical protein
MEATLKAALHGVTSGSVDLSARQKAVLDAMDIHVLSVGGNADNLGKLIKGTLGDGAKDVITALQQYVGASLADPQAALLSVPVSYTLSYLDYAPVGMFAANPAPAQEASADLVNQVRVMFTEGVHDDKECGTKVWVSLVGSNNQKLIDNHNVADGRCGPRENYWNHGETRQFDLDLSQSVPAYDLVGAHLSVISDGDTWHAQVTASVHLAPTLGGAPDWFAAFTSTPEMYYEVDPGNHDPCQNRYKAYGYEFTLKEPRAPEAGVGHDNFHDANSSCGLEIH